MAQVVLENIYKSFLHSRQGKTSRLGAAGLAAPAEEPVLAVPSRHGSTQDASTSVLRRIGFTVKDGEFMVLVGPSGCGKSTLLRLIAGLEKATAGNIWVGDRLVNDLPPKQRDIAMVFQSYALYPHMTVYENLAFGLRRTATEHAVLDGKESTHVAVPAWAEKALVNLTRALPSQLRYWSEQEKMLDQRVRTVGQMLQIEALFDRLPKQLSGGQKQRVALGRAMARNPQVFLMDEPLSNLDAKLRIETRSQIVNLQRKLGTTTIYVTHDQTEAMTMGDRIAVMNAGQIQQIAPPLELYNQPANRFVAEFIGTLPMNFLTVEVKAPLLVVHPLFRLTLPEVWELTMRQYDGRSLILGIRPEHFVLSVPAPKNIPVRVERVEALGSETFLSVLVQADSRGKSQSLKARVEADYRVSPGEHLWLALMPEKIHLFDAETGLALPKS